MYLRVHIITMNVTAGAYYHESTCWCILLPQIYLLVHIIAVMLVHIITLNVLADAYYYRKCACWCILLPRMYLLVHIITGIYLLVYIPQTCSAVKPT